MNTRQPLPRATKKRIAVSLIGLTFVLGGLMFEISPGARFVFVYGDAYESAGWWAFGVLLLLFAASAFSQRVRDHLRSNYPTWWVRWLLMYPISMVLSACAVVVAPLGWIAGIASMTGADRASIPAQMTWVDDYRPEGKGCHQRGRLLTQQHLTFICLDGVMPLPAKADQAVLITGKQSSLGLLIESITPQEAPR